LVVSDLIFVVSFVWSAAILVDIFSLFLDGDTSLVGKIWDSKV
jgi:hypothetical protein